MAIFCGIVCISMHAHYFLFFVVVVVVDLKKKGSVRWSVKNCWITVLLMQKNRIYWDG